MARIFDVYQGDAIDSDKKSLAIGLTLQHPSRTLNEAEISAKVEDAVAALAAAYSARLR